MKDDGKTKKQLIQKGQDLKQRIAAFEKSETEPNQVEEALKKSEERFRLLLENAPEAIFIQTQRQFAYINKAAVRLFGGISPDQFLGQPIVNRLHPDGHELIFERIRVLNEDGKDVPLLEQKYLRLDGTSFDVAVSAVPIIYKDLKDALVFFRDITARRQAEEALRRSEAKFRAFVECSHDGIYFVDANGITSYRSPSLFRITGYTDEERLNHSVFELVHPEDMEAMRENLSQVMQNSGFPRTAEYRIQHKDGSWRWVETTVINLLKNPDIQEIVVTTRDITERKQMEELLRHSEEKYKALIETTDTGYLILDAQGKVVEANKEYLRLAGYDALEETIGRNVAEWTADHDRERNTAEVAKCLKHGFVRGLEIDYRDREGRITPVEIQATVIRKGNSFQIISLCRDISARKRTEYALRLSEEKLSKAFQTSPDWISISTWDDGRYTDVNDAFLRLSGYRREEVVGFTSREIRLWENPDDRERAFVIIRRAGALKNFEVIFRMKSGKKRIMSWSAEIIELEGKKFILSVCQDITDRKRAEEELQRAKEELELRVKERTTVLQNLNKKLEEELIERKRIEKALKKSEKELRLLSNRLINAQENERKRIAYELHDEVGQSLVALKLRLSGLPKKLKRKENQFTIEITQVLDVINEMTENIRRISRELRPSVLEHLGILEALQWLFEDFTQKFGIKVFSSMDKIKKTFSRKQEIIIFRVFQEALSNIGKHSGANQVNIVMTDVKTTTVFSIRDNGKGFNLEEVKGRNPLKSGLGLIAMKERAVMAGGTIEIKSEIGQGTSITFSVRGSRPRKK